ncbi:uncharacterized protein LOC134197592 [Corticium candelabrum]|uniref:uncharacterized protein LOC134197592 n=1 Tax=Corticium candelabrum TaxID=121492 RepID=UPI002E26403F|nr:uncharacterized protein LOC134197592 [Corticium candelabrum]
MLGVLSIVIFVFCGTIMFTTWISLPFMSCFPHVIPLYIVGTYGVIDIVFSLPNILSIETAFCEDETSTSESPYCLIQGVIMVYGILFSSLWYFCFCFNIYLVVVHNKPHLILSNRRAYLMQSVVCWLLPTVSIAIIFSDTYRGKYFDWIGVDYFLCVVADIPKSYYFLILPLQLTIGIGSTILFLTALFLFKSDEDSRGLKLMQNASKNSGITSLGKRLSALCLLSSAVGIYLPCSMSYLWTFSDSKEAALLSYFECKQVTDDCPQDFLQYSVTSIMIPLRIVIGLYFLISSLFLFGTPAQIKLWKHWIARLLLCCHVPDPDGKYAAWKNDADLQQYHRSQASIRRLRVLQQAETWKNKTQERR